MVRGLGIRGWICVQAKWGEIGGTGEDVGDGVGRGDGGGGVGSSKGGRGTTRSDKGTGKWGGRVGSVEGC